MSSLNFPSNPNLNDVYTANGKSYKWDGYSWSSQTGFAGYAGSQGIVGYTGSIGLQGFTGSVGFTGSAGSPGSPGPIGYTGSVSSEATSITVSPSFKGALIARDTSGPTQTLNETVTTKIELRNVVYDYNAGTPFTSTNDRITIPAGVTKVKLSGSVLGANQTDDFFGQIYKNGVGVYGTRTDINSSGTDAGIAITPVLSVVEGDYFELFGFSTVTRNIENSTILNWLSLEVIEGDMLDTTSIIRTTGFTGSQGLQGPAGGYTGSQGELGFTGSQGELGFTGSIGYTGSQGIAGSIGFTGSAGTTIVQATPALTTSGNLVQFSIPSWAKRVTLMFDSVSTSGTSGFNIQVATTSQVITTGYKTQTAGIGNTTTSGSGQTSILHVVGFAFAVSTVSGQIILTNVAGNSWVYSGITGRSGSENVINFTAGSVTLPAVLDRIVINALSGGSFDAGQINVLYE